MINNKQIRVIRPGKALRRRTTALIATCLLLSLLAACNLPPPTPPEETSQALRTVAPAPGVDPLPIAGEYLTDVSVVSYDPFDNLRNWKVHNEAGALTDGMFQMSGQALWHSSLSYKHWFTEGEGLAVRFKVQNANARSEFVVVSGQWLTDSFKQFGVYNSAKPQADLFQGTTNAGGYEVMGNLTLQPEAWYEVILAIGHNGHFLAVVWDPNNGTQRAIYDLVANESWAGQSWQFLPKANEGETVTIDDFYRLAFGEIK